ncbi:MAG: S8 family serine peptidase [Longimicrobiales bacterium]
MTHRRGLPESSLWIVALAVLFAACSEEPTRLSLPADDLARFNQAVAPNVPEVRIDLPVQPRAWDTDDQALVAAIAAGENIAVIAIKEPESQHTLDTGVRAAVSADAVEEGMALLEAQVGVEVFDVLENLGMVRVHMDPALAPILRQNPLVDFIEPRQYGEIAAQVTPWGIEMVRAPEAWTVTTGGGAKLEIIDTGHDQGHEDLPLLPSGNCSGAYTGCSDGHGHGTHVMGIATARDNTIGVVGVAPGISASDVYAYGACTDSGSCPTDEVTAGINAGIFTVDVINLSLSQPYSAAQSSAVAQAWQDDIVLVAAAGNNDGGPLEIYPALYST